MRQSEEAVEPVELRARVPKELRPASQRGTPADSELEIKDVIVRDVRRDVTKDLVSCREQSLWLGARAPAATSPRGDS